MTEIFPAIVGLLTRGVDFLLLPFAGLPRIYGLLALSLLSGVLFLILYGKVSDQQKIRAVKRKIGAALLECVLFRHNLAICLRAQARMFLGGLEYFLLAIKPLFVLALPGILLLGQTYVRYGVTPLKPGESTIVRLKVTDGAPIQSISLQSDGALNATPPVRVPGQAQIFWRVSPQTEKGASFRVTDGKNEIRNSIATTLASEPVTVSISRNWLQNLLIPSTGFELPAVFRELSIDYPDAYYPFFGVSLHWIAIFCIASLASGLVTSKMFRIEI